MALIMYTYTMYNVYMYTTYNFLIKKNDLTQYFKNTFKKQPIKPPIVEKTYKNFEPKRNGIEAG